MSKSSPVIFFEVAWLIAGILCLASMVRAYRLGESEQAVYFAIFTITAGVLYYMRRSQRIRMKQQKGNDG